MNPEDLYEEKTELLKALAHPVRLRIVRGLLRSGCRNVSCMERNLAQSQSCISQHLAKLKAAGIVQARRSGNEIYYEVDHPQAAALMEVLFRGTEEEPCGEEDGHDL